jgi:protoheme IX farnesyltransferase
VVVVTVILAAWVARRSHHRQPWIVRPVNLALATLAAQIALGAWMAMSPNIGEAAWLSALHLGLSLLVQAALLVSTVVAFYPASWATGSSHQKGDDDRQSTQPSHYPTIQFNTPFARLSLATLAAVFTLLASGALVSAMGAAQACPGWPLCLPASPAGWISLGHRLVVLGTAVLVTVLLRRAWHTQRSQPAVLVATTAVAVLFFAQALMGARLTAGFPAYLLALHRATAAAVWAALVVQVISVRMAPVETPRGEEAPRVVETPRSVSAASPAAHARQGAEPDLRRGVSTALLRDFLMLTKPVVVALLLVTTYAGMVIGAKAWPSFSLTLWTLLGGFMAAGGSGAINQYIDRFDDQKMQRTQKRPIPSGRLTPAEGLAFGVGMALASFYLVAAMVNFLAALLVLAGIIYYVLIYSLLLKKTTVQNIVIGGGAGAIPPLVGWAAATGGLNIPSLFLFAVVFMWTPPHFWALALVRRNDYARAGVPMLPVVRGEQETRWQIFIYTLELVGLTLLLPLFGLGGSVYLVGAVALGGWLLLAAWRVWKQGGNKVAWKMYRYSSMYLAFLFVVLMVDALV